MIDCITILPFMLWNFLFGTDRKIFPITVDIILHSVVKLRVKTNYKGVVYDK